MNALYETKRLCAPLYYNYYYLSQTDRLLSFVNDNVMECPQHAKIAHTHSLWVASTDTGVVFPNCDLSAVLALEIF